MSEYQYYEFQAIDRPLSKADQAAMRALSSRAQITATSFINEYQWGDFKGRPGELMAHCFDLHLYLANWGTRRLMIRLPKRLVPLRQLDALSIQVEGFETIDAGDNLVVDITREEIESEAWAEGAGRLAALAPLRADLLGGDLRLFYLVWLMRVGDEALDDSAPEPLPGIGPMTGALEAFADFFAIDPDLVAAAAEQPAREASDGQESTEAARIIANLDNPAKDALLLRLFEGDPLVAAEVRALVRKARRNGEGPALRTAGALQARAEAIAAERQLADAAAAETARLARVDAMVRRGGTVWREIETEIERRSNAGYDAAVMLLKGMREVAETKGSMPAFSRQLTELRQRHARKGQFISRISGLG